MQKVSNTLDEEMVDGRGISVKVSILVDSHSDSGDGGFSPVPIRRTSDGEDGMEILPMIVMNKEYTGNSILDNLSRMDSAYVEGNPNDEGEPEVTSDQSAKSKQFTSNDSRNEGKFNPVNIENSIFEMQVGGLREWEKLCLTPMHISWPKPWCLANPDPIHWDDIMSSVRQSREMVPGDATGEPCRLRIQKSIEDVGAIQCNFFTDHVAVVDCLAKWLGSLNLNEHEARRKQDGNEKGRSVWLDMDRDACQEEEAIHRQKMKKRKTKGKNPFTSVSHQQTSQGQGAEQDQDMGQKRKFMRVR
ncbi:hypothetical protein L1987_67234 [Smallanthus sonchifolius]|uniref:Uncharacterized protein n=1 Tax=Smallanthus sonchifolius TaxID=185202 RepID=A0ACB9BZL4_9ASTR|nr:hypothetical protein L1987_67234 [Smallanthus sonchifolius]